MCCKPAFTRGFASAVQCVRQLARTRAPVIADNTTSRRFAQLAQRQQQKHGENTIESAASLGELPVHYYTFHPRIQATACLNAVTAWIIVASIDVKTFLKVFFKFL